MAVGDFDGPFDLLLSLVAQHRLDITEVSLAAVTDEFISYIKANSVNGQWDLNQTSEFLVVAATLLDMKTARLLPTHDGDDPEDVALLEAKDLLFARLLQYRAFRAAAADMAQTLHDNAYAVPRQVAMEPGVKAFLPDLVFTTTPEQLAALAVGALYRRDTTPTVSIEHLHQPKVSVREQAMLIAARLRENTQLSFEELTAEAETTLVIVGRFLAVLELFRERLVDVHQSEPFAPWHVVWVGADGDPFAGEEFATRRWQEWDEWATLAQEMVIDLRDDTARSETDDAEGGPEQEERDESR